MLMTPKLDPKIAERKEGKVEKGAERKTQRRHFKSASKLSLRNGTNLYILFRHKLYVMEFQNKLVECLLL